MKTKCSLFLSSILSLLLSINANAQVDVSSSGGTINASYPTLKGAFDAINAGIHAGTITIGISGNTTETAPAILNAVYNATGKRVRDLPVTPDKLM